MQIKIFFVKVRGAPAIGIAALLSLAAELHGLGTDLEKQG